MIIITKKFFILSIVLFSIGYFLGSETESLIQEIIQFFKLMPYGDYVYFFIVGIPLAFLNELESKYVWSRIFNRSKINLLGISSGFLLGILSLYYI